MTDRPEVTGRKKICPGGLTIIEALTVIRIFPNRVLAELAASVLASEGINALVAVDDVGGAYPVLQQLRGVRLLVAHEDEKMAQEILRALEGGED